MQHLGPEDNPKLKMPAQEFCPFSSFFSLSIYSYLNLFKLQHGKEFKQQKLKQQFLIRLDKLKTLWLLLALKGLELKGLLSF